MPNKFKLHLLKRRSQLLQKLKPQKLSNQFNRNKNLQNQLRKLKSNKRKRIQLKRMKQRKLKTRRWTLLKKRQNHSCKFNLSQSHLNLKKTSSTLMRTLKRMNLLSKSLLPSRKNQIPSLQISVNYHLKKNKFSR
jgi:hypothetical protein